VTVWALPQEFSAAVPTSHADVRIEIEDRVFRELAILVDERGSVAELTQGAPDRLMDAERMRILNERCKEQVECFVHVPAGGEVA
jgi:hypothetical protein